MQDLSRLVIWLTATLCHAIHSPFRTLFTHRDRRCGHVSMCPCRFYDIVCNEGFCIFGAKIGIFYGSHVLCKVEFEDLCYLGVCGICGFPIVV